eukprot:1194730-Prorocentrum_minimum.AAC.7
MEAAKCAAVAAWSRVVTDVSTSSLQQSVTKVLADLCPVPSYQVEWRTADRLFCVDLKVEWKGQDLLIEVSKQTRS